MAFSDNWILLVDPFKNLLNTYRMVLEAETFPVETATDLKEAIRRFGARRYAVLMTEYFHPFEATSEMIQWVKKNSPETYIIMVTNAVIDNLTYENLFNVGVDDVITKPYSADRVLVHLKRGLRQRDLILKKQELENQSLLDVTGYKIHQLIFGSAYFKRCLRQELKRAKRHLHPLSVLLIKIPGKEDLGDRFEDFCAELGRILRSHTREEDMVGRENGHFGVLLPETDQSGSKALSRRLLNLIQSHSFFQRDEDLKPAVQALSFQSFTYPDRFDLPLSLKVVLDEVVLESPHA
jgi:PleD family two-component response regulator